MTEARSRRSLGLLAAFVLSASVPLRAAADPRIDYMLNCRGCHGPEGRGLPGAAPSFHGQLGKFLTVPGGRDYLVRVPGTAQSELSDARIAELLNWMVRAFDEGNGDDAFAAYTEQEVASYRAHPLTDVEAARRDLLHAIEQRDTCKSD